MMVISRQLLDSPSPDDCAMSKEPEVWFTGRKSVKSKTALVIAGPELVSILRQKIYAVRLTRRLCYVKKVLFGNW